jgi:signal transduction histidine kinase
LADEFTLRGRFVATLTDLRVALATTQQREVELRLSDSQLKLALEERERLGRNLHDSIIQSIYAVGLRLAECRRVITQHTTRANSLLKDAIDDLNMTIREVRNYIAGIEIRITNGRELAEGVGALVNSMGGTEAPRFYVHIDPAASERLTALQATHLLYTTKEAMSNALRHAQARNGGVSLRLGDGRVQLQVEDDGVGFASDKEHAGSGLGNIRTRAEKLGAHCEVLSLPGRGTRLTIDVPLESVNAGDLNRERFACCWSMITRSYGRACAPCSRPHRR